MQRARAIFLDRDGVINKMYYHLDVGAIDTPLTTRQVEFVPHIFDFLRNVKKLGYLLILVSNQPGFGLKKLSWKNFSAIKRKIAKTLNRYGISLDGEYYCFHHPYAKLKLYRKHCTCRKPRAGLFKRAIKDFNIDIKKSWLIGDGVFDIVVGKGLGVRTILLANINEGEYLRILEGRLESATPDFLVKSLKEAWKIIKKHS